MPPSLTFFQRPFPSANSILLHGTQPILIDTGFRTDAKRTVDLLHSVNTDPRDLQMVVNTHWHCDHAGGNSYLQTKYGVSIGAHTIEARRINNKEGDLGDATWLSQPFVMYEVNKLLEEGDVLDTGDSQWQVIATPGHAIGHICLFCDGVLIAGDTVHSDDVAWLQTPKIGTQKNIEIMLGSVEKLATLKPTVSYSGHGALTEHPQKRLDDARRRYEKWAQVPEKIGWHATKRIATYEVMLHNGMTQPALENYLLKSQWFADYARDTFNITPEDFTQPMIDELLRSGALVWQNDLLYPSMPFTAPK